MGFAGFFSVSLSRPPAGAYTWYAGREGGRFCEPFAPPAAMAAAEKSIQAMSRGVELSLERSLVITVQFIKLKRILTKRTADITRSTDLLVAQELMLSLPSFTI